MAVLPVLTYPDERLRQIAEPVREFNEVLRAFVSDLFETMYAGGGVGLAATQVGIAQRALVMDCPPAERDGARTPLALINPLIVAREGSLIWKEGCLSLPGVNAEVERDASVTVAYQDPIGAEHRLHLTGLAAVCLQHELDHLDGQLYVDRLGLLERKAVLADYEARRAGQPSEAP